MAWKVVCLLLISAGTVLASTTTLERSKRVNDPNSEYQLLKDIFSEHNPLVWPFPGKNTADVQLVYVFNALLEFDEKRQILRTSGMFFIEWEDNSLVWEPKHYNDTNVIYVHPSMIWKPDMVIVNSVKAFGVIGTDSMKMYIDYEGHVMWFPGDFFETYCKVDITYYPLDVQKCKIDLKIWGCPQKGANVVLPDNPVDNVAEKNGEWEVLEITSDTTDEVGRLGASFVVHLKRRRMFYVVNMMLPVIFLSFLNFLVFGLPAESGEKMTLSISVLISYAVFLTLVNDKLPENSEGLCCFSAYLAAEVFISVTSTLVTVLVLNLYHRPRGTRLSSRYLLWMVKPLKDPLTMYDETNRNVWTTDTMELMDMHEKEEDGKEKPPAHEYVLWRDIAKAVDRFCFRLFWFLNTLVTILFLLGISGIIF
ncbi:acetylcholine receptor subunit alpha-1-A-like [Gigantopelta aegis]|uniref:acetylcholine receptor subunit alpha-1-A-like n=1 Tax=Gigantopelta aegis TaxID=1735272 RepID=UPI001B88C442|nr:acetylcholine receptor subunit alpha-1-A-like [Gigantopelta aegis]